MYSREGVIGNPKLADAEKARAGVERTLDYLEKLVNDILEKYPAGELPPIDMMTQRKREDIEAVIKGPKRSWRTSYLYADLLIERETAGAA